MNDMIIVDDKLIKKQLQKIVDKIFKILPLYEEKNSTVDSYIESLILEITGFTSKYGNVGISEYMSVISTLEGLRGIIDDRGKQPTVKREVFKCIETINKISDMLEGG